MDPDHSMDSDPLLYWKKNMLSSGRELNFLRGFQLKVLNDKIGKDMLYFEGKINFPSGFQLLY